ncbi:MAG: DUF502 domain-containing protein [Deltaproteobacteria bacterium]|jgi:uncharacterized membrane protein
MRIRRRHDSPAARLAGYFGRGLLVFVPTVGSLYTLWLVLSYLDSAVGFPIPGIGLVLTVCLIVLIGFLLSNVLGQAVLDAFEGGIRALPVVSLLYTSLKDLLGAFVGDKKSFDRPAMVALDAAGTVKVFGFVTCDRFDDVRLKDMCAIYLPQAYNFAGNILIVPKAAVELVDAEPAQFMAFIVSGGVSAMGGARTQFDSTAGTTGV